MCSKTPSPSALSWTLFSHIHKAIQSDGEIWEPALCLQVKMGAMAGRLRGSFTFTSVCSAPWLAVDSGKVKPFAGWKQRSSQLAWWRSVCSLTYKLIAELTSWFKNHKDCWGKPKEFWVLEHRNTWWKEPETQHQESVSNVPTELQAEKKQYIRKGCRQKYRKKPNRMQKHLS